MASSAWTATSRRSKTSSLFPKNMTRSSWLMMPTARVCLVKQAGARSSILVSTAMCISRWERSARRLVHSGPMPQEARISSTILINRARSFIFSTALPPSVCAASIAGIDIVEQDSECRDRLWKNRNKFANGLNSIGINTENSETPIIPIIIGDSGQALKVAEKLFEYGIYAPRFVRPRCQPMPREYGPLLRLHIRRTILSQRLKFSKDFNKRGFCK